MTRAAIRNIETGEIAGSISDKTWSYETLDFKNHVENLLAPNDSIYTITATSYDEGSLSDSITERQEGDIEFGGTLIENLDHPYYLVFPEKREEFEI